MEADMEKSGSNRWAIVLAGGEGKRLQSLTRDAQGTVTPKQYCSIGGGLSLLSEAIERAARVVSRDRIVTIVAPEHQRWWSRDLRGAPAENVIVQPCNRGTLVGVLLPLLCILERDPEAHVLLVPSDHYVADERALWWALRTALDRTEDAPDEVILLGITPDSPETEYGWIVPAQSHRLLSRVDAFLEKPSQPNALRLQKRGGLWNSFLIAASGPALLGLYADQLPELLAAFSSTDLSSPQDLGALYENLEPHDFSQELLQGSEKRLRVLRVLECGWTDLGTPKRLAAGVRRMGLGNRDTAPRQDAPFDLAQVFSRRSLAAAN
jgi:mannose-1-phosphate guanylyltransferase